MAKSNAITNLTAYLHRLLKNDFDIKTAYLFGSFARGNVHPASDIDLAIVLNKLSNPFEMEVSSMILRSTDETIIELHLFDQTDFTPSNPFANEIMKTGIEKALH
jgi:predicted nucleotidyltransferase